jgi:WbqC-like protein family
MKLGIMQPYFMPYIGYFQLIAAVDLFIVYDNIKYTKKGWINRNRMLLNDADVMFSLPLKKASDTLDVIQRELSADFNRNKLLSQFKGGYGQAPHFPETFQLLERIFGCEDQNLFQYIYHSLIEICRHLGIKTKIRVSSNVPINHDLKAQDKVLAFCDAMEADTYINTIGGTDLYNKDEFRARGVDLKFIKAKPFEYEQFNAAFVPWLSIVDLLMFNPIDVVQDCIHSNYELI